MGPAHHFAVASDGFEGAVEVDGADRRRGQERSESHVRVRGDFVGDPEESATRAVGDTKADPEGERTEGHVVLAAIHLLHDLVSAPAGSEDDEPRLFARYGRREQAASCVGSAESDGDGSEVLLRADLAQRHGGGRACPSQHDTVASKAVVCAGSRVRAMRQASAMTPPENSWLRGSCTADSAEVEKIAWPSTVDLSLESSGL